MSDYRKKALMSGKDNYRTRTGANIFLWCVLGYSIFAGIVRLYWAYPIPSRRKPVLTGDYFWDAWHVKSYLRSWGIKGTDGRYDGEYIHCVTCYEGSKTCVLDLRGEKVDHLEWCDGLPISSLNISGTRVSDLGPLATQTNLYDLRFDDTPVSDLSPLAEWARNTGLSNPTLPRLSLKNTKVADLSPLKDIDIKWLELDGIPCVDLSPIRTNHLERISFSLWPDKDWQGVEHLRASTNLVVVNWHDREYAWFLYDFFYSSGRVDRSRYSSPPTSGDLERAIEAIIAARKVKDAVQEENPQ